MHSRERSSCLSVRTTSLDVPSALLLSLRETSYSACSLPGILQNDGAPEPLVLASPVISSRTTILVTFVVFSHKAAAISFLDAMETACKTSIFPGKFARSPCLVILYDQEPPAYARLLLPNGACSATLVFPRSKSMSAPVRVN